MLKYLNTMVTFSECPEEIALCINITNCHLHCEGCHSPVLWKDVGNILTTDRLDKLIKANDGITIIVFMGGDNEPWSIDSLACHIKNHYKIKVGWYSGEDTLNENINPIHFDIIKLGHYDKDKGGLDHRTTNQRYYKVINGHLEDCTKLFWK